MDTLPNREAPLEDLTRRSSTTAAAAMGQSLLDLFSRLVLSIFSVIRQANETLPLISLGDSTTAVISAELSSDHVRDSNSTTSSFESPSDEEGAEAAFSVPGWVYVLMTSLYACIFVVGICGNLLVILVIAKDRRMRTTANFYLISLSVADLMIIAFCLPVAVYELHAEEVWSLGPVLCKLAPLLQYLSTNASISTMVAISIERYLVVCKPLQIRTYCTNGRACGLIVVLWLFSLACSSPLLQFTQHELDYHHKFHTDVHVCYINHYSNEGYFYFHQACFYVLPGILLSLLYSRIVRTLRKFKSERFGHSPDSRRIAGPGSKSQSDTRQLIFMLSAVVLSYFVCLLPYNCITFLSLVSHRTLVALGPIWYNVFLAVSRICFFVNSCTNPIMYNALSGKFRDAFKTFFCPKRFKNRGLDSRTMSVRSRGGGGGPGGCGGGAGGTDEDQPLNRRIRTETFRLENGGGGSGSGKFIRGTPGTSSILLKRTWSGGEIEKDSGTGTSLFRSDQGRHHSCSTRTKRSGLSSNNNNEERGSSIRSATTCTGAPTSRNRCVEAEL